MFALTDILSFDGEKRRILKPVWVVVAEYLVKFLVLLSLVFLGMQFTSGSFECLPAVECPAISRRNTNSSSLSQIKYRNVCEPFYSSQKTKNTETSYVITDIKTVTQYGKFVNSECSKSAIPKFLAYFGIVLFAESFVLLVIGTLWLKIPTIAAFLEHFNALVTECYVSPLSNLEGATQADDDKDYIDLMYRFMSFFDDDMYDTMQQTKEFDLMDDITTVSAVKTLHKKVNQLKMIIKSSHGFLKIWRVYLFQCSLQALLAIAFLAIDIYFYKNDWAEKVTCRITEHIPVPHEYFICSHRLAPTFAGGLIGFFLPTLGLSFLMFCYMIWWTVTIVMRNKNDFGVPESVAATDRNEEDLRFLLQLLHHSNKVYESRFTTYLKKIQGYILANEWPVSKLEKHLEENGKSLTFVGLPGIPPTIFHVAKEIETLKLIQCDASALGNRRLKKLTNLKKLSIIRCKLRTFPESVLNIKSLKQLSLNGNFIYEIDMRMSQWRSNKLENLITLDLSDNELRYITSLEAFNNLTNVNLSGNAKLDLSALKVVLKCEKLQTLEIPEHLEHRVGELDEWERSKFNEVIRRAGDGDDNDGDGNDNDGDGNDGDNNDGDNNDGDNDDDDDDNNGNDDGNGNDGNNNDGNNNDGNNNDGNDDNNDGDAEATELHSLV